MTQLKLSAIPDDKPVKMTLELPAVVHRDLVAYAEILTRETDQRVDLEKLVAPMLAKFMASDRGFAKAKRAGSRSAPPHFSLGGRRGGPPA